MNNCYCPCFCASTFDSYYGSWKEFLTKKDTFAIIDNQGRDDFTTEIKSFIYNERDIRKNLHFEHEVSKRHYWNSQGNRNIIWFYAHLRMMNFYLSHPSYDYYWFFDDDFKCSNLDSVLETSKYDSDFLSYFVFKHPSVESQCLVPKIDDKTYSKAGWFDRFPGDKDTLPEVNEYFGSFFPITRFSNAAMKALVGLNDSGYYGYSEGFVPTTLNKLGYKIDTFFLPDNTSRHFDVDNIKITHKNSTINWEWI